MDNNTYLISSIKEIKIDKLVFLNNENQLQELSFIECRKNWVDYYNTEDDFITIDGKPVPKLSLDQSKCVGNRDWFAEKPYYEFYSNPKIRFEIHPKKKFFDFLNNNWRQRYYPEFSSVDNELHKVELCTFDLG